MRTDRLDRGYERLDPRERFRLMVAAEAREDSIEIDRLLRSCPRSTYRLCDPSFSDRHERAAALTLGVLADLDAVGSKLNALAAAEQLARAHLAVAAESAEYEAFRITGAMQPSVRRAVRRERGRLRSGLRMIRRDLLAGGATIAQAFAGMCRDELELDPRQLIAAVAAPYLGLFDTFVAEPADEEAVTAIKTELAEAWQATVGREPFRRESI